MTDPATKYSELLACKPNSPKAYEILECLLPNLADGSFVPSDVAILGDLLKSKSVSNRQQAAWVLRIIHQPIPGGDDLIAQAIESEKDRYTLKGFYMVLGRYPARLDYLKEQFLKQKKPDAKQGILVSIEEILGSAGLPLYVEYLENKKACGSYWVRRALAVLVIRYGDEKQIAPLARFTRDVLNYDREMEYDSSLLKCIRFLHEYYPDNIETKEEIAARRIAAIKASQETEEESELKRLNDDFFRLDPDQKEVWDTFKLVKKSWEYRASISDTELCYLKQQYGIFRDIPLRAVPSIRDLTELNERLAASGLPKWADIPQCKKARKEAPPKTIEKVADQFSVSNRWFL